MNHNSRPRHALILSWALISGTFAINAQDKPNFLFILADDVTHSTIGCFGGKDAKTPNIDQLASEGMRFTKAYSAMAMCAPFRAELYTGLYPLRNGVAWNHSSAKPGTMSVNHYLRRHGYRVALSGKKHASPASTFPFKDLKDFPAGNGIRDFMEADTDKPFCLFLCSHNAHAPWTNGDSTRFEQEKIELIPTQHDNPKTREVMSRYLAEVEDLDRETGEILQLLEDTGKKDNTIVMFSSEQGWALGFAKWSNWDLGVHTGFIARWPGKIKAGSTSHELIQMADVLPTFLEAAGAKPKKGQFDGLSFYRHLLGKQQPMRKYVYGVHNNVPEGNPYPIRSIRDKDYHYILNLTPDASYHEKHVMIKDSRLTWWPALKEAEANGDTTAVALLEKFHNRPAEELYNLDQDPYEMNNLADNLEHAATKKRLNRELLKWMADQKDPGAAMDDVAVHTANRNAVKTKKQGKKK
ncbi:sulfatase [Verrucomicrobia bacterium]|nr:sulfatase [Verrucomicrobiota bacterium]